MNSFTKTNLLGVALRSRNSKSKIANDHPGVAKYFNKKSSFQEGYLKWQAKTYQSFLDSIQRCVMQVCEISNTHHTNKKHSITLQFWSSIFVYIHTAWNQSIYLI